MQPLEEALREFISKRSKKEQKVLLELCSGYVDMHPEKQKIIARVIRESAAEHRAETRKLRLIFSSSAPPHSILFGRIF